MKVLVAVKSCQRDRNQGCHAAIRETWGENLPDWVDVRFFIGGDEKPNNLEEDEIYFQVGDDYHQGLVHKVRAAFTWATEQEYDFGFFCDTDTYITSPYWEQSGFEEFDYCGYDVSRLNNEAMKFGKQYPSTHINLPPFTSVTLSPWYVFVGGGGYFLSRRALDYLVNQQIDIIIPEDLWVGQILGPLIERGEMKGDQLQKFQNQAFFHFGLGTMRPRPNPADVIWQKHRESR
jgi:hypothetical protein